MTVSIATLADRFAHVLSQPLVGRIRIESWVPPLGMHDWRKLTGCFERDQTVEIDRGR